MRGCSKLLLCLFACACFQLATVGYTSAKDEPSFVKIVNPFQKCNGDCSVHIFSGRIVESDMLSLYGLNGFEPLWKWDWGNGALLAGAFSRRLASFGDLADVEAEAGVAKRFGDADEMELWGGFNFRWKKFPWNHVIHNTVAFSGGVSFATDISDFERRNSSANRRGSKFLFYLSPEITFALPEHKDWALVFRVHHRSGGQVLLGKGFKLFNRVDGGSQYGTVGIRHHF